MSSTSPAIPDSERIGRALAEFGIVLAPQQTEQVISYLKLLIRWNEKLNLTAIRDPVEILHRHFSESMFAGVNVPIERGRLADVGSGAGFPGLPLKILRPELQVFLIESNLKKAAFLAEVIRDLSLSDTRVIVGRYEDLGEEIAPADFVCSRAVGEFDRLVNWAAGEDLHVQHVVLWVGGRDLDAIQRIPLWKWRALIAIPHSLRRFLLVGDRKT
jgi:16S rRNA (guanine527-N7)-methyltransferase